jgi:hypothetical protein
MRAPVPASHRRAPSDAYEEFISSYVLMQALGSPALVRAAMTYAYRLFELDRTLQAAHDGTLAGARGSPTYLNEVVPAVRAARSETMDAVRVELGVPPLDRSQTTNFNPFSGTSLEDEWARRH